MDLPEECGRQGRRELAQAVRPEVRAASPRLWDILRPRLRVVMARPPTYADAAFGMVDLARGTDWGDLTQRPDQWKRWAWNGGDMVRVKRYWRLRQRRGGADVRALARAESARAARRALRGTGMTTLELCRARSASSALRPRIPPDCSVAPVRQTLAYSR